MYTYYECSGRDVRNYSHSCIRKHLMIHTYVYAVVSLFRQYLLRALSNIYMHKVGVAGGLLEGIVYHRLRCGWHAQNGDVVKISIE